MTNTTTFPGYGYFLEQVHTHPRLHHAPTLCPLIQPLSDSILPPCPRATHHGPRIGTHRKKQTGFCLRCTVATMGSVCGSSRALLVLPSTPPLTPPCPFARRLRRVTSRGHRALGMCAVCQCIFDCPRVMFLEVLLWRAKPAARGAWVHLVLFTTSLCLI